MAKTLKSASSRSDSKTGNENSHGRYFEIALGLLGRILLYDLFFLLPEVVVFLYFELWDALVGLALGTVAISLGFLGIAKSYERYATISLGKAKIPKQYFVRYIFYASVFLLSSLISQDRVFGIVGTFVGMINFKLVLFAFSWRWNEWGRGRSSARKLRYR